MECRSILASDLDLIFPLDGISLPAPAVGAKQPLKKGEPKAEVKRFGSDIAKNLARTLDF